MNAVVVQHPTFPVFGSGTRVDTELRRLQSDTFWITLRKDAATGLQNFTPELVREFQGLVDHLQYGRSAPPRYAVVQSAHPEYFSMGGDLRFFRDCIQRRDALRLLDYSMRCLDLLLSWGGGLKETSTSIALVQGRALGGGRARDAAASQWRWQHIVHHTAVSPRPQTLHRTKQEQKSLHQHGVEAMTKRVFLTSVVEFTAFGLLFGAVALWAVALAPIH